MSDNFQMTFDNARKRTEKIFLVKFLIMSILRRFPFPLNFA